MINRSLRVYIWVMAFIGSIQAQTINKGVMAIEKGTNNVITLFDFTNDTGAEFLNDDNFHVKANYTNNGTVSYNAEGTTLFTGENKQSIKGGTDTFFYNVVFNNPTHDTADNSAFALEGDVTVESSADFKKGIVNNKTPYDGLLIFGKDGKAIGANDGSYVNGKVEKVGDKPFEFPVGAYKFDQYRYAGISAPPTQTNVVNAEYLYENSDAKYPHNQKDNSIFLIDNKEYWNITGTKDLILTLSWDEETTPEDFYNQPENIRIAHWNETEQKWENYGGVRVPNAKAVQAPVKGEGIFTLALIEDTKEDLVIYNAISPNDDNLNDRFLIEAKNGAVINRLGVEIYNRWGILVFESDNYQSDKANTFFGYSKGRLTIAKDLPLPRGTYFYILNYDYTSSNGKNHQGTKVDYLYIANDPTQNGTL